MRHQQRCFFKAKSIDVPLTIDICGLKEDTHMANRHMEICSTLLIIRERPTDTAVRYHLIPIRMAIIKQLMNCRCWRGCGEEGNPLTLLGECKLVQPLWKTVWKFLKKTKSRLSI